MGYNPALVDQSVRALYGSGHFEFVEVRVDQAGEGKVDVFFELTSKYTIQNIRYNGNEADSVEWPRLLSPDACDVGSLEDCTVACEATVGEVDRSLCNSHYTALELKNALVDDFRDRQGLRPSVDTLNPHLPLQLHVHQDTAWLFRTLSPFGSMHRRGYRQAMHVAVLRENLAAALVLETGLGHGEIAAAGSAPADGSHAGFGGPERIDPDSTVLCDPMCGSATLAIEAALIATRTAPGLLRWGEAGERLAQRTHEAASGGGGYGARGSGAGSQSAPPPFWYWADYSRGEWAQLLREAEAAMRPLQMRIHLNDAHAGALALAKEAFGKLGYGGAGGKALSYSHADIGDYTPPEPPTLIVANPPYGMSFPSDAVADTSELLGEGASDGDAASAWEGLGRFAKAAASAEAEGLQLWTLSGASDLTKHLRMRATKKLPISHGGVDLRWIRYDVLPPKREWLGADGRRAFDDNKAPAPRIGR